MILKVPAASYYSGYTFFRDFDIPLRVIHVEHSNPYPDHHHEFDELVIVQEGTGSHIISEQEFSIRSGDVFFIRHGQHHQYLNPQRLRYINVIFDEKALLDKSVTNIIANLPPGGIRLNVIDQDNLITIINRIDQELYDRKNSYTQMARAYLMQLICLIHRAEITPGFSEEDSTESRIRQVTDYLRNENGPEISIRQMAEASGTCTRNFHRVFRRLTGMPPLDYVNRLRINKACELLINTGITITSISSMVHYSDSNYFTRQFKKFTGTTPTAYRKSHGELD